MQPDEPAWAQFLRELDSFLAEGESTNDPSQVHSQSTT